MTEEYGHAHIDTPDHLGREQYSITDLSTEFGVTARALRFYEDEGLISPRARGCRVSIRNATVPGWPGFCVPSAPDLVWPTFAR